MAEAAKIGFFSCTLSRLFCSCVNTGPHVCWYSKQHSLRFRTKHVHYRLQCVYLLDSSFAFQQIQGISWTLCDSLIAFYILSPLPLSSVILVIWCFGYYFSHASQIIIKSCPSTQFHKIILVHQIDFARLIYDFGLMCMHGTFFLGWLHHFLHIYIS